MKNILLFIGLLACLFIAKNASSQKIDLLILNHHYEQALHEISHQITKMPNGGLYFKQGVVYTKLNNYKAAVEAYKKALGYTPNDPVVLGELAETLSMLGNNNQAVFYFEQAVLASKDDLALKGNLGKVYINLKDYVKAFETFAGIYKADSSNVYWNKQFAFCAHKLNKTSLSIHLYEKVLADNPYDVGSYINLAAIYHQANADSLALKTIDRGLEIYPDDATLLLKQANQHYSSRKYSQAKTSYERYLALNDSSYNVLKEYGITLYFTGFENKSIEVLEKCVVVTPDDPYVLFYLSLGYKKLAVYDMAEGYMNTAIEAATPFYLPEMYHHLGQILGQQRKYNESIAALKESYGQDPKNFEILFEIATTYEEFNHNKTLALNFYRMYLLEAKEEARNATYALDRMDKIKEILFMDGQ